MYDASLRSVSRHSSRPMSFSVGTQPVAIMGRNPSPCVFSSDPITYEGRTREHYEASQPPDEKDNRGVGRGSGACVYTHTHEACILKRPS